MLEKISDKVISREKIYKIVMKLFEQIFYKKKSGLFLNVRKNDIK